MVGVGKAMFCGKREPECLRHMVHWQIPFWEEVSGRGMRLSGGGGRFGVASLHLWGK